MDRGRGERGGKERGKEGGKEGGREEKKKQEEVGEYVCHPLLNSLGTEGIYVYARNYFPPLQRAYIYVTASG